MPLDSILQVEEQDHCIKLNKVSLITTITTGRATPIVLVEENNKTCDRIGREDEQKSEEDAHLKHIGKLKFTCIFPIKSAKRMSPKMASAMLNIDSPG